MAFGTFPVGFNDSISVVKFVANALELNPL
jgi:hypothetical protein